MNPASIKLINLMQGITHTHFNNGTMDYQDDNSIKGIEFENAKN